jgi:hypothetical protein
MNAVRHMDSSLLFHMQTEWHSVTSDPIDTKGISSGGKVIVV